MEKLSTQPYKGARDFYPEDMKIRQYIFETWRKVCKSYGYEEYDFPILEPFEIFAAKTGAEIVNEQLYSLVDRGDRKLAIRPELTPGTVRMIAQKHKELLKPIRWYMIGNNWRAEKPQKGRGREFYQLEVNIFGVEGIEADAEIFSIIVSILKAFGAKKEMFGISVSDRKLINTLLLDTLKLSENVAVEVRRLMDKKAKMENGEFMTKLSEVDLDKESSSKVVDFMSSTFENLDKVIPQDILKKSSGYNNIKNLFKNLEILGILDYCTFDPSIIRGFDYSDGLVYEVFDKNPENNRSMFGGERFDKLINIFGVEEMPATGFAMGDWTLLEFLNAWKLLPSFDPDVEYMVARFPDESEKYDKVVSEIATSLRENGINVICWLEKNTKIDKQLKYANRRGIKKVIIVGEQELKDNTMTIKDMESGKQETVSIGQFLKK